jgi:predicted secreted hydrolase
MVLGLVAGAFTGCCPDPGPAGSGPAVRLPLDEAPHCSPGGEWWYYTGRVTAEDGAGYGIEAVIFHVDFLPGVLTTAGGWVAHLAVLDEATGAFVYDQERVLGPNPNDLSAGPGFDLSLSLVQMTGSDGQDHLRGATSDGTYAFDLDLRDQQGPVLHGDTGYVAYGSSGSAFYYSRPRMAASGTLSIRGELRAVTGSFWFDRQWGPDLPNPNLSWDWLSLRLDNGDSIMLFTFRDGGAATVSLGTYMPAGGEPREIEAGEFDVVPTAWWTSPHTGATYPVAWIVRIPSDELELTVTALADDQELDARPTTFNIYWEGLCTIEGTRAGQPVAGHAYVEMPNYTP